MAKNPTSPLLPSSNFHGGHRRSTSPPYFSDTPSSPWENPSRATLPPSFYFDVPSLLNTRRPLTSMTNERGESDGGVPPCESLVEETIEIWDLPASPVAEAPPLESLVEEMAEIWDLPASPVAEAPHLESLVEETAGIWDLPASPVAEDPHLESLVEETIGIWDLPASPVAEAPPLESFVEETAEIWDVEASSFANSRLLESFVEETPGICDFVEDTPGIWETESKRVVKKRKKAAGQTSGSAAGRENGMDLVEAAKIRCWEGPMDVTILEILQLLIPAYFRPPTVRSFL